MGHGVITNIYIDQQEPWKLKKTNTEKLFEKIAVSGLLLQFNVVTSTKKV